MTQEQNKVLKTREAAFINDLDELVKSHGVSIFYSAFAFENSYWLRHGLSRNSEPALDELKAVLQEEINQIENEQKKDQA